MGHQDRVIALPGDAVELADNPDQENQAFRIAGKPIYGTQFHSELDKQREHERLIKYRDLYTRFLGSEAAFQAIIDGLVETSEVDHLMYDFLVHFVCN